MTFVSYSQNFEDVMLWRSLQDVEAGRYLDIGAQDPDRDSVSKAFFEAGWRGVHVDANLTYVRMLRTARLDEQVIHAMVGEDGAGATFYEIPETGLSTGVESIADRHRAAGYHVEEVHVPSLTLAQILNRFDGEPIHWMKVDVEGMEAAVLRSWQDHPARPWVLSIEATYPNSQIPTHDEWIDLVLNRGYREVYFDGLSRYFVHETQADRASGFASPPNVFDGFAITEEHFAAGWINHRARHQRQALEGIVASRDQERQMLEETLAAREKAWSEEYAQAQAECDRQGREVELTALRLGDANTEIARQRHDFLAVMKAERDRAEARVAEAAANLATAQKAAEAAANLVAAQKAAEAAEVAENERVALLMDRDRLAEDHALQLAALNDHLAAVQGHLAETQTRLIASEAERGRLVAAYESHHALLSAQLDRAEARSDQVGEETRVARDQQAALTAELNASTVEQNRLMARIELLETQQRQREADLGRLAAELVALKHAYGHTLGSRWWKLGDVLGLVKASPGRDWSVRSAGPGEAIQFQDRGDQQASLHNLLVDLKGAYMHDLSDLLACDDEDFVRKAYLAVLGREGDVAGIAHYTLLLGAGDAKVRVLRGMRQSAEGRSHLAPLPGLDAAIRRYSLGNLPLLGWLVRRFIVVEAETGLERQVRRIATQVARVGKSQRVVLSEVHRIRHELNGMQEGLRGVSGGPRHTAGDQPNDPEGAAPERTGAGGEASASRRPPLVRYFEQAVWNGL